MNTMFRWQAAAILLVLAYAPLLAHACTSGDARTQAGRLMRAAEAFDSAAVLELTHPTVFSDSGDAGAARERLRAVYASLKAGGLAEELGISVIENVQFGNVRVFKVASTTLGAYLPYIAVQRVHGTARPVKGWLLGICGDAGRQWRFAEGRRLDAAAMRRFLPGWNGKPPPPG